jgi:hypothetical protein
MKFIIVLVALLMIPALPASAKSQSTHDIYNETAVCVWMTLDVSSPVRSSWTNKAAEFVKPGEHTRFTIEREHEIKVRAEPRGTAACTGGRIADLDIIEKGGLSFLGSSETTLRRNAAGAFSLKWGR